MLASIRLLNRLELVAETLRAALDELAAAAPDRLRGAVPAAWSKRSARRVDDGVARAFYSREKEAYRVVRARLRRRARVPRRFGVASYASRDLMGGWPRGQGRRMRSLR